MSLFVFSNVVMCFYVDIVQFTTQFIILYHVQHNVELMTDFRDNFF